MADTEGRTEAATPKRLQTAREQGQFAVSREVAPVAVLGSGLLVMAWLLPPAAARLTGVLGVVLERADTIGPLAGLRMASLAALPAMLPFAVAATLAAMVSALAQTGLSVRLAALRPSFTRLNLPRNLGRILGRGALVELGRSLLKCAIAGYAIWLALRGCIPWLGAALLWEPAPLLGRVAALATQIVLAALLAQILVAGADIGWTRWSHARQLRMSRQELRDEHRDADGDPQVKARIRRIRLSRARKRMLAAVAKATVVVTNPTHYAVALAYERGAGGAPRVVAKGVDAMAARIRELAQQARVPIIVNPPLAQALWRLELDSEIPAVLFQAVAEIIAYVWRLRTPARRR